MGYFNVGGSAYFGRSISIGSGYVYLWNEDGGLLSQSALPGALYQGGDRNNYWGLTWGWNYASNGFLLVYGDSVTYSGGYQGGDNTRNIWCGFPLTFPNVCLHVLAGTVHDSGGGGNNLHNRVACTNWRSWNTTGFFWDSDQMADNAEPIGCSFVAFGY